MYQCITCGKKQDSVTMIIALDKTQKIGICDECIGLCCVAVFSSIKKHTNTIVDLISPVASETTSVSVSNVDVETTEQQIIAGWEKVAENFQPGAIERCYFCKLPKDDCKCPPIGDNKADIKTSVDTLPCYSCKYWAHGGAVGSYCNNDKHNAPYEQESCEDYESLSNDTEMVECPFAQQEICKNVRCPYGRSKDWRNCDGKIPAKGRRNKQ